MQIKVEVVFVFVLFIFVLFCFVLFFFLQACRLCLSVCTPARVKHEMRFNHIDRIGNNGSVHVTTIFTKSEPPSPFKKVIYGGMAS